MKKWGVRLIGCGFIIRGISNSYGLILGIGDIKGFMGIHWGIFYNDKDINFMEWVGVYLLCYIGIQLLRFDTRGRIWALIMSWPATVFMGIFFLTTILSFIFSWPLGASVKFQLFAFQWSHNINTPTTLSLATGITFIIYAAIVYFLMRKDVKTLFSKNETIEGQS